MASSPQNQSDTPEWLLTRAAAIDQLKIFLVWLSQNPNYQSNSVGLMEREDVLQNIELIYNRFPDLKPQQEKNQKDPSL